MLKIRSIHTGLPLSSVINTVFFVILVFRQWPHHWLIPQTIVWSIRVWSLPTRLELWYRKESICVFCWGFTAISGYGIDADRVIKDPECARSGLILGLSIRVWSEPSVTANDLHAFNFPCSSNILLKSSDRWQWVTGLLPRQDVTSRYVQENQDTYYL